MAESHSGGSEELLGSKVAGKRTESAGSMKKGRNSRRLHGRCRTHRKMSEQHPKPQHFLKESLIYEIYPQKFELSAVTVDLGFDGFDLTPIKELCRDMDIPYQIVKSDIYHILFDIRKESNPCSLCAKMRKGALNQAVKEMGCNKVAYAHHKDDIVETMLLSMIFEGRFYSFSPKTWLDRMDLTVIRPLMFVDEMDVIGFKNKYDLPVVKSKCPVDGYTKRQYAKDLLRQINREHPGAKERMFHAILNGNIKGWPERQIRVR